MRAWPVALLLIACGSDPLSDEGAAGSPSGGESGAGGQPSVECDQGPGYAENPSRALIERVDATVLDETGAAYADLLVQVCGLDICVNGYTDDEGVTSVGVNQEIIQAAFKYGDGLGFGKFALPLDPSKTLFDLGELRTVRLPEVGAPIRAGATSTSEGASLTLPAGATFEFDLLLYRTEEQQAFRAAELELASAPEHLLGDSDIELLFALAPVDTEFCPAATLELPNSQGWDAGTEIEFLLHGLDLSERFAPYGGWAVIATGAVDESGERLVMLEGGVRTLGSIGVRRR